jgi:integrase
MQRKLTDVFLKAVKPPAAGRLEIHDLGCTGLAFRVTSNGACSWSFRFRDAGGAQTRATVGRYPTVGLLDARRIADDMRREVGQGGNPVARKRQDRADAGGKTFAALAQRYLIEHAERRKRSHQHDRRNLAKHVLPSWGARPYASIRRADVIELIERLIGAGKPTLANRVQSLISGVFTFALDADLVEANPCHRLKKRGVENVGRRVLSDSEIRLFWSGIVEPERSRRTGLGLRLALLLGARVGEIAGLARCELAHIDDPARAAWTIPATRVKNGRDHLLPLPPLARDTVLELLSLIGPDEQFLFPTRSGRRNGPMRSNSLTQAMDFFSKRVARDSREKTWDAEPPTPHDLRRTLETRLAELRIPKEIRDRVLNHVSSDIGDKHYNMHDYADEKRDALARWSAALSAILWGTGANVTLLRSVAP